MKTLKLFTLFIFILLSLSACAVQPVQTSNAVQIPQALQIAFGGLVLAGVMLGLQALFDAFGLDLRGVGVAIVAAISAFAIGQVQGWIDVVPAAYDQLITIGLNIALVVLTGVGYIRAFFHKERAAQLFRPKPTIR